MTLTTTRARPRLGLAGVVLAVLAAGCGLDQGRTSGEGAEEPLKGETIDFVVPYDTGGGYDTYVRMLAPVLEKCSGATVVVRNEPGAGGLLATSKTYVTPPDELRLQIVNTVGAASAQIAGAEGARFELEKFTWLGRISTEPNVMVVAADSDIRSFDDVLARDEPVSFVATGPGSNEYINSTVLPEIYGFPAKVVTGFAGSDEARAAVLAGDADAHILPLDSQADAIASGDVRPVLVLGEEKNEALPDTPTLADFPPDGPEQEEIMASLVTLAESGRAVVAPPSVDDAARRALEDAMTCALEDRTLRAEAEQQKRSIAPLSGQEMARLIDQVLASPESFRRLLREASGD